MLYTKYYRQPELLYAVWTLWIKNIFSLDKWTQLNCRFHNVVIELIELKVSGSGSPSFFIFILERGSCPIWFEGPYLNNTFGGDFDPKVDVLA